MRHSCLAFTTLLAMWAATAHGQELSSLQPYHAEQRVSGTLRSWGNDNMAKLDKLWEEGFHRFHPEVQFDDYLKSTATGIGALFTSVADLAMMGREIWPAEVLGFQKVFLYEPLGLAVATGSYDAEGKTWPMIIYVHKDNPISKLTLAQLDAIFGAERKRGIREPIRTWGQLGLKGEWANKPIHVYGYDSGIPGFTYFFQQTVFKGSDRWTCDLHEFYNAHNPDGSLVHVAGELITKTLGEDRYGIAYTGMQFRTSLVKPIALAEEEGGPYIEPTKANVANRTYPLTRSVYIFINHAPGKPVDPKVKEFLRYILSREGQQDVVREGDFLPLTSQLVHKELQKLE